jgi:hypothetical protein
MAVLGMTTDSPLAMAIDAWVRYGFSKKLGRFDFRDGGTLAVYADHEELLAATFYDVPAETESGLEHKERLHARWTQPLLGGLHDGRLNRSWLRRDVEAFEGCRVLRGDVSLSLPSIGRSSVDSGHLQRTTHTVHAVAFGKVPTRISRPARIG